jgi:hypothetical protein
MFFLTRGSIDPRTFMTGQLTRGVLAGSLFALLTTDRLSGKGNQNLFLLWKRKCVSVSRLSSYGNELLWKRKHISVSNYYGNGNVFPFPDSLVTEMNCCGNGNTFPFPLFYGNGNLFPFPYSLVIETNCCGNGNTFPFLQWKHVLVSILSFNLWRSITFACI